MVLADLGADVVSIERVGSDGEVVSPRGTSGATDVLGRGRPAIGLDLKSAAGRQSAERLIGYADVLIEGFRPGVIGRLGLGPHSCLAANPGLIYGRITGWGQHGPLAQVAGHDVNYIAVAGALHPVGRAHQPPVPPVNLLGDFAGGGLLIVVGVLAALVERQRSGCGQVVDAAMVDGAALLTAFLHGARASGHWNDERGTNLVDTVRPFYDVYETSDGGHMAVGAIESAFYAEFLARLELDAATLPSQHDPAGWPALREAFAAAFRTRTQRAWTTIFEQGDGCVSPVLSLDEAPAHPHNQQRGTFITVDGVVQPAPAPRFSRTSPSSPRAGFTGEIAEILASWRRAAEGNSTVIKRGDTE